LLLSCSTDYFLFFKFANPQQQLDKRRPDYIIHHWLFLRIQLSNEQRNKPGPDNIIQQ
jgi:hypothetical protein